MVNNDLYIKGGNRAVILLHAYTGSPNDVRMLARSLQKAGYTILAPLFSGHGVNDPDKILSTSPEVWLQDSKEAVNRLRNLGYTDIAIFGLSLGGVYAMTLLEMFPDLFVGGGTFCSPLIPTLNNNIYSGFLSYSDSIFRKTMTSEEEITDRINRLKTPLNKQLLQINALSSQAYQKASLIRKPVFLAQAGKDEMIEANGVYELGIALKKTYHEIHWYPNSTHVITVSKDRQLFEADVHSFLNHINWNEE